MHTNFWDNFAWYSKEYFETWVIQGKQSFSLIWLYWAYIDCYLKIEINDINVLQIWKNKEYHELFLTYLSTLLRNWELKMKTFEQVRKDDKDWLDGYVINSVYPGREWKQEEIEEGIEYVRQKWNSITDERERRSFEDWWVMFTLPENEWMY